MKLTLEIKLEKPVLPKDYRRGFMSLIKSAFERGDELFFQQLYGQKLDKPFTFSVYFPGLKGSENGHIHVGDKAILNFSSNDPVLVTHLYNGTRKIKRHEWQSYNAFTVENLRAFFNKDIKKNHCLFKTISPFLVNSKGNNLQYLNPEDDAFDNGFRHSIQEICRQFLGAETIDFDYQIIKYKKMVVSHYNQSMTCNKGIIEMKAHPKVLSLLHNIGIGVRRSQGFGMVELM